MKIEPGHGDVSRIFHFALPAAWQRAQAGDLYAPDDMAREGFIHAATAEQIPGVTERHLRGKGPRILLTLDCALVADILQWEWSDASGDLYPHLFGPIPLTAVIEVAEFDPEQEPVPA